MMFHSQIDKDYDREHFGGSDSLEMTSHTSLNEKTDFHLFKIPVQQKKISSLVIILKMRIGKIFIKV